MKNFTQEEKEKYLSALSEDDFREKVVRRLFKRIGFLDGRDLCGPDEQGKDAVFFEEDKFGGRSLICVQTKKGSITLSSDSTKNLHDIRAQIRTALESPFRDVAGKQEFYASKVYLIASGAINEKARSWITSNIGSDPRISYLDRDDLIARIDMDFPDLWLNITSDIYPYLTSLARLVDDQGLVAPSHQGINGLRGYYAASDSAFVDLRLIKSVSILKRQSGKLTEEFKFEEDGIAALLALRGERLLVLGDAGTGKSTLLTRAAYLMAREGAAGKSNYRVPVIVRAGDIANSDSPVVELMQDSIDKIVGKPTCAFTSDDLETGRVVLLVDGLDEVSQGARRVSVVQAIERFYSTYPRCSVVLATRPYTSIEEIPGVRAFTRCRILPMSLERAEKMLVTFQKGAADSQYSKEILRRIDNIHGIELNPLLVTVFALTSEHNKRDIPANITELFSKFTELMLGRWDEAKGLAQQHQARIKEHLVSHFSYRLHLERRTRFSRAEFEAFSVDQLRALNYESDVSSLIEEIVERSGLLRGDRDDLEFRHHLIQEYFAGKGIPSVEHVKQIISDEWWRNAIVFHFGSNPDDVQSLLDVATSVSSDVGEACLTIGIALQTCYLSRLEDKIDVWKWVVEGLSCVTDRVLIEKEDEKFPIIYFVTHYILARDAVALSGIEREEVGAIDWAVRGNHFSADPELRRFWAFVGLSEIGRLDVLYEKIKESPIDNNYLNLALSLGCRLVEAVRSVDSEQKRLAKEISIRLRNKVSVLMHDFAKQYRSQLLEYRKGGIVALDQHEPSEQLSLEAEEVKSKLVDSTPTL